MRPQNRKRNPSNDSLKSEARAESQGFLANCMVEADPKASSLAEMARGRAIGVSAVAQACLLALLLIVPLFATSRPISVINAVPIAPYGGTERRGDDPRPQDTSRHPIEPHNIPSNGPQFHPPTHTVGRNDARESSGNGDPNEPPTIGFTTGDPIGNSDRMGLILGFFDGPRPPQPEAEKKPASGPVAVSEGAELAELIRRVEPVYPIIAVHSHIQGTVQLRAIIGRDGAVREVHVLSGNSILAYAAQEAVKQWRFRPTLLNGQPVEVDTFFTVVFKIKQ